MRPYNGKRAIKTHCDCYLCLGKYCMHIKNKKNKSNNKAKRKKDKKSLGQELIEALEDCLEYEAGNLQLRVIKK